MATLAFSTVINSWGNYTTAAVFYEVYYDVSYSGLTGCTVTLTHRIRGGSNCGANNYYDVYYPSGFSGKGGSTSYTAPSGLVIRNNSDVVVGTTTHSYTRTASAQNISIHCYWNADASYATYTTSGGGTSSSSPNKNDHNSITSTNKSNAWCGRGDVAITISARSYNTASYTATTSFTYNGSAKTCVTNLTGCTVSGTNSKTDAGGPWTATVTCSADYKFSDGTTTKSVSWSIAKAAGSVTTPPTAKTNLLSNGSAQTLINAGSGTGTMYYSLSASSGFSTSLPTGTAAQTYTVYYYAAASTNYNKSSTSSLQVTIGQGNITLTIWPKGGSYAGNTGTTTFTQNAGTTKTIAPATPPANKTFAGWTSNGCANLVGMKYTDAVFDSSNGLTVYDNAGSGRISMVHETSSNNPLKSYGSSDIARSVGFYRTAGSGTTPGMGGFRCASVYQATASHVYRVSMLLYFPKGYYVEYAGNSMGTGYSIDWLTTKCGTGDWEWYVYDLHVGTGTVSTFGYQYFQPISGGGKSVSDAMNFWVGWYQIQDITGSGRTYTFNNNAHLEAAYFDNNYTVTFDKNTGTGGTDSVGVIHRASTTAAYTQSSFYLSKTSGYITSITIPTKTGYDFQGYYDEAANVRYVNESGAFVNSLYTAINGNMTLKAKWKAHTYTNTMMHWASGFKNQEGNNGTAKTSFHLGNTTWDQDYETTKSLDNTLATQIPNGYQASSLGTSGISGTFTGYPLGTSWTQGTSALSCEFYYYPITYNITYELNGGTNDPSNPSTYNVLYGVDLKAPTKENCVFGGWYANGAYMPGINKGANASFTSADDLYQKLSTRTTGDLVLTAYWRQPYRPVHVYSRSQAKYVPTKPMIYKNGKWKEAEAYVYYRDQWVRLTM